MHRTLPDITTVRDLAGTYVLLRASLNVPIEDGVVTNTFRLRRALPTIEYLVAQGARIIMIGHVGREPEETLAPVFDALQPLVPSLVWCKDTSKDAVAAARGALADGDVLLLENLRQDPRERTNDPALARELAALADVYVNDAFDVAHREHASVVSVPHHLPSYFGVNFIREFEALSTARTPTLPALFMLGGAKFDTKLPLITQYLDTYTHVFVGGALAHDIWRARGYELGTSLTSDTDLTGNPILDAENLLLPIDVTVQNGEYTRVTTPDDVRTDEMIVDAGPNTVDMLANYILAARTVLWNGPMGRYEDGYATATKKIAEVLADAPAHATVGGGDTVAAIESLCISEQFGFLSTAGGAMLAFLERGTLPAIDAVCGV